MMVLLRKEIRSLLPAWVVTIAATALIAFVQPNVAPVLLFLVAIGSLLLGITSFGSEFSQGTFSLLLAQPIPRNRIWWTKTITLGAALLSVAVMVWFAFVCLILREGGNIQMLRVQDLEVVAIFTVLILGAAFAGGLLSALATRQMATAFWIALLFPLAACGAALVFTMSRSDGTIYASIAATLAVYDILAFVLARYQFLRAQDLPSAPGAAISLPAWLHFGTKARSTTTIPSHRPWRALIRKEFQLHQVSLAFGAVLLVLHIIVLFIRRAIVGGQHRELYEILGSYWLLWFVLPVVIAGTAVAEERRQGTLESSLCLPARKGTQWFIKCVVCFSIALFFGGVVPWLLEIAAEWTGCPSPLFESSSSFTAQWQFLYWTLLITFVATLVTFYASSLSRSLLQAVGIAILIAAVFFWIAPMRYYYSGVGWLIWKELRTSWLAVLSPLFLWLSYTNFKHLTVNRRLLWKNALMAVSVLVFASGTIAFFWQLARFFWPLQY